MTGPSDDISIVQMMTGFSYPLRSQTVSMVRRMLQGASFPAAGRFRFDIRRMGGMPRALASPAIRSICIRAAGDPPVAYLFSRMHGISSWPSMVN